MTWLCEYTPSAIKISKDETHICDYELLKEPFCEKCSSPGVEYENCLSRHYVYGFNRIIALGMYLSSKRDDKHMLSKHIRGLKYHGQNDLAVPLGTALSEFIKNAYPELLKADNIVPVPNYDQMRIHTELLTNVYCSKTGQVPLNCLRQVKPSGFAGRGYGIVKRFEEVKGMFELLPGFDHDATGDYALLLDDVVTSGSQSSACSQVLLDNGFEKVDVITLGRNALGHAN